jgi:hypothetical protein
MALQELATTAVKYGSLSDKNGIIERTSSGGQEAAKGIKHPVPCLIGKRVNRTFTKSFKSRGTR